MKFLVEERVNEGNFSLVYIGKDHSFDVEPLFESGETSVLINDLQLEIDHESKILYVWGYCPLIKYEETREFPRGCKNYTLVALLDKPQVLGVSHRLNENKRWPIYLNKERGWVCIGNPMTMGKEMVEFAPQCVATIESGEIIALWLKPQELPEA